ncbi:MAG: 50S ribosomal protein L24 [Candidatus Aenigmarchaeota archaeon]|nr:50S ribosomal protein L24 [Candidatus Aenigmarchaeota archaeon]
MNTEWSSNWKSSKETAKQRKYGYNAPLHVKRKFLSANLSDTLRKKVGKSSVPVRLGDEAVVKRGSFKGSTGEVIKVIIKEGTLHIKGIVRKKTDGTEIQVPLHPSNVQILSMNLDDPKRLGGGDSVRTAKVTKAGKTGKVKKAEDVTKVKAAVKDAEPKDKEKPKAAVKKVAEKDVKKTVIKKTAEKTVKASTGASGKKTPAAKKPASAAVKKAGAAKSKK